MPRISDPEVLFYPDRPVLRITAEKRIPEFPDAIGGGYAALARHLGSRGGALAETPFVGFRHIRDDSFFLSVYFPLLRPVAGGDGVLADTLAGGEVVTCMYLGPYDGTMQVYKELYDWLDSHGAARPAESFEIYYNGTDYPEDQLLTRIIMPVTRPEL